MRRVVVTGLGMVTPLACGVEETWKRLLDGQSGAGPITRFDTTNVVTKYACEIPMGDGSDGTFNADDWMEPKERRKVDDFILYGMAAAVQAVKDAGWEPQDEEGRLRTGVHQRIDFHAEHVRQVARGAVQHDLAGFGALDRGDRHAKLALEAQVGQRFLAQPARLAQALEQGGVQQYPAILRQQRFSIVKTWRIGTHSLAL